VADKISCESIFRRTKLYIDILYHVEENKYDLDTDIKEAMLPEVLSDYLRAQMGKGRDNREPNRHESFHIRIELDLTEDTFKTQSDTGNAGLTTGIVMNVLEQEQAKARV